MYFFFFFFKGGSEKSLLQMPLGEGPGMRRLPLFLMMSWNNAN
jgi:hypothetical protein